MPPWLFIVFAWCAFAAAAPLSGDAHIVTSAALLGGDSLSASFVLCHAAAALALAVVGGPALRSLPLVPLGLGLAGAEGLRFLSSDVRSSVLTVGVGVLGTAAMLAALRLAPRNVARRSPARDTALAAATLALAGIPGASPIACALAARAWSGRRIPAPAAALWAAPFEARAAFTGARLSVPEGSALELVVAGALMVAGAMAGARTLRLGPERVARFAGPYLTILGAALLAYAWSLS